MEAESKQPVGTGKKRPSRRKNGPAYEFVVDASTTHHGDARAVIRRQAARSGCRARLRKSRVDDATKKPESDYPSDAQQQAQTSQGTQRRRDSSMGLKQVVLAKRVGTQPSLSGYEALRAIYNVDVTALDSFTNVDFAATGYRLMVQDHLARPGALLGNRFSTSFLAHLPARYGTVPFVNDAIHCVVARAAEMLGQPTGKSSPAALYGKAIHSLRSNMQSSSRSDLYCATRLLVLYESLGCPDVNALAFHNKAGINLLRCQGPPADPTSFDLMLFKSQGPYVLISEMHEKQSSIFESPKWQDFFEQAARREKDPEAHFWWKFFGANCFLQGILKDARNLFANTTMELREYLSLSSNILERAQNMHQALLTLDEEYKHFGAPPNQASLLDLSTPGSVDSPDRLRIRHFLQYPVMFLCRLRASLCLSEDDRATSEEDAQKYAATTLHMEKRARTVDPNMAWHLAQRNSLPYSIVRSREDWLTINEGGGSWEDMRTFLAERWFKWEDSWHDEILVKELGKIHEC